MSIIGTLTVIVVTKKKIISDVDSEWLLVIFMQINKLWCMNIAKILSISHLQTFIDVSSKQLIISVKLIVLKMTINKIVLWANVKTWFYLLR